MRGLRAAARPSPGRGTTLDASGRVRSVQAADVPWLDPAARGRVAEGYWAYVRRTFHGLVATDSRAGERRLSLLVRPLVLLRLAGPEGGPWRTVGGLLLARGDPSEGTFGVDVEGAAVSVVLEGYRPSLAVHFHPGLYMATQARLHEWVGHRYLRELARAGGPPGDGPLLPSAERAC